MRKPRYLLYSATEIAHMRLRPPADEIVRKQRVHETVRKQRRPTPHDIVRKQRVHDIVRKQRVDDIVRKQPEHDIVRKPWIGIIWITDWPY